MIASFLFPSPAFGFASFMTGGQNNLFGGIFNEILNLAEGETGWIRYFKPWMINGLFNIIFSGILICLSAWKLKPVKRRRRKGNEGKGRPAGAKEG